MYSTAVAAATKAVPWIRTVDVWHVSHLPEYQAVFLPSEYAIPRETHTSKGGGYPQGKPESTASSVLGESGAGWGSNAGGIGPEGEILSERVIGRTWDDSPVVVLRSLRTPGQEEEQRAHRWRRAQGGSGGFGDDEWSDRRLRLLAEEWELCVSRNSRRECGQDLARRSSAAGRIGIGSVYGRGQGTVGISTQEPVPVPFTVHTGHIIVPFLNGRVREDNDVIGHGLALEFDPRFDWKPWEPLLVKIATETTRRLEEIDKRSTTMRPMKRLSVVGAIFG